MANKIKNPFGEFPEPTNRDATAILEAVSSDGFQMVVTQTEEKLNRAWAEVRELHDSDDWRRLGRISSGVEEMFDKIAQMEMVLDFLKSLGDPSTWQLKPKN